MATQEIRLTVHLQPTRELEAMFRRVITEAMRGTAQTEVIPAIPLDENGMTPGGIRSMSNGEIQARKRLAVVAGDLERLRGIILSARTSSPVRVLHELDAMIRYIQQER